MTHTLILCEAASLMLIVTTAIHDLTPQRTEGRELIPVQSREHAQQLCSIRRESEHAISKTHPERGRISVRCTLVHADGIQELLTPPLVVP